MAGKSHLDMHPYMRELMSLLNCEDLYAMSRKTTINYNTLRHWAFNDGFPSCSLPLASQLSRATGITINDLEKGFMRMATV